MDQMPIFFNLSPGKTLSQSDVRAVNGCTSSVAMLQVTVAVTVTASGDFLCPLVVFNGKPGARIETREFPTFPPENLYAFQERAWMDKRVMQMWVRFFWKPYVETVPGDMQPALLLDSYRCHVMASIVNKILEWRFSTTQQGARVCVSPSTLALASPSRPKHLSSGRNGFLMIKKWIMLSCHVHLDDCLCRTG